MRIKQIIAVLIIAILFTGCDGSKQLEKKEQRPEIKAAIDFVLKQPSSDLDVKSAKIISETDTYCDVAFSNPVTISSGKQPQGEVFKVDKISLSVTLYGAD